MCLVGRAVYRLGWKKVEYIYTEREKSFVGQLVGPAAWPFRRGRPMRPLEAPRTQTAPTQPQQLGSLPWPPRHSLRPRRGLPACTRQVGITIVFVILWLCGHLYRAVHGRRGSWMQLQLPFLTLTNSYLALLTHSFWPGDQRAVAPAEMKGAQANYSYGDEKQSGLLDEEDD